MKLNILCLYDVVNGDDSKRSKGRGIVRVTTENWRFEYTQKNF